MSAAGPNTVPLSLDDLRRLARCAVGSASAEDLERARTLADDPATAPIVVANRVGPLLARALRRAAPDRALPRSLVTAATTSARSTLALQARVREIGERFARSGIRWLLWKGPALGLQAWGSPTVRSFSDIDLVIRPADRARARRVLAESGWRARDAMTPKQQRWVLGGTGAFDYEREGEWLLLELHWRFSSGRYPPGPGVGEVMLRAATVQFDGFEVPVPDPVDTLLLAAMHGTKHGWSQLEEILTFDRLHARSPEAALEAGARAVHCGLGGAWQLAMEVRARLLDSATADESAVVARLLRGDAAWRPDHAWTLGWINRARDRVRYWLHALLAPTRQEWEWVRLPGALAWLYPAVRLARLAVRR